MSPLPLKPSFHLRFSNTEGTNPSSTSVCSDSRSTVFPPPALVSLNSLVPSSRQNRTSSATAWAFSWPPKFPCSTIPSGNRTRTLVTLYFFVCCQRNSSSQPLEKKKRKTKNKERKRKSPQTFNSSRSLISLVRSVWESSISARLRCCSATSSSLETAYSASDKSTFIASCEGENT